MTKPRLGIVLTEFGIPSEVWALRQAEVFSEFEPVYFAQSRRSGGLALPEGRTLNLFNASGSRAGRLLRRVQRKAGLARGALPSPGRLVQMQKCFAEADLDIVLTHFAWNGIAAVAALEGRLPVVCHVHGRDVTAMLRFPHYRRALAQALPRFAHVVTVGSQQQDILADLYPAVETSLIPCGAPIARFAARPLPQRAPEDVVTFITVGRISPEKGQAQTLRAFERMAATIPEARLVVVGDGPAMSELRTQLAKSSVADRVRLTGVLDTDQVAAELAAAHIFVQHSRPVGGWVEGFGVTLVEAAAAGLPLVASSQGGIPDQLLHGENGYLFETDDVAAQADFMRRLASDEALRRRMGQRAREMATTYDSDLAARRLEQVLMRQLR